MKSLLDLIIYIENTPHRNDLLLRDKLDDVRKDVITAKSFIGLVAANEPTEAMQSMANDIIKEFDKL